MPPKKRPVSVSAENSAEKKLTGYAIVNVTHCDYGAYTLYKIPMSRLGPGVVEEFVEAEAQGKTLSVIPCDSSPTCLRKLGIRLDCYVYDSKVDPEELKDVMPDLIDCKVGHGPEENDPITGESPSTGPEVYLHLSPVFMLATQDWC